jgi:MFS family permease
MADLTTVENRGRVLAARSLSSRIGGIAGPFVAAAIGVAFGLRAIFLFNTVTKLIMLVILLRLIRETRPESARVMNREGTGVSWRTRMAMFLTRPFMLLMLVTLTQSMMSQGIFMAIFPVYLQDNLGFNTQAIGNLLTLAGAATLIVTFPNGILVDIYGRKRTLVPGLLFYALSAVLLTLVGDFSMAVAMVLVFGLADGVAMGSSQAYVIDMAPEGQRGAFIGSWSFFSGMGGVIAPLLVGLVAGGAGYGWAFLMVAASLVVSGIVMGLYGPDFGGRARRAGPAAELASFS